MSGCRPADTRDAGLSDGGASDAGQSDAGPIGACGSTDAVVGDGGLIIDRLSGITGTCGGAGSIHPVSSTLQLQSLLLGRWKLCTGTLQYGPQFNQQAQGIEIDSVECTAYPGGNHGTGSFVVLVSEDGGELVPAAGFNSGGIVDVSEESAGGTSWQVNLWWNAGGGSSPGVDATAFTDSPAQMDFGGTFGGTIFTLLP